MKDLVDYGFEDALVGTGFGVGSGAAGAYIGYIEKGLRGAVRGSAIGIVPGVIAGLSPWGYAASWCNQTYCIEWGTLNIWNNCKPN